MYQNTLGTTISNTHLEESTRTSSNPCMSLALYHKYISFCYISYDQRPTITCLSDPTYYWGNLHGYHTRPYTKSYSSPYGNCHHKETSPTTGDQTQLQPKTKESHRPSMSTRIWIVISSYLSVWKCYTKTQSHTHGPLQSIQITKVKPS